MKDIENKDLFLEGAARTLRAIIMEFRALPVLRLNEFSLLDTVLVNVDINNGFCKYGPMYSPRVEELIPYAVRLNELFKAYGRIYFLDRHTPASIEFKTFTGIHCLEDSPEADIVPELAPYMDGGAVICRKNSTNGFLCGDYARWLETHPNFTNFIVIGDVLDICVMQYALTQKKYCDEHNIPARVILVKKATDTYDYEPGGHNADLMNLFSLYNLKLNGIEIAEDIINGGIGI
jgi:nicotinamidase-related amidase